MPLSRGLRTGDDSFHRDNGTDVAKDSNHVDIGPAISEKQSRSRPSVGHDALDVCNDRNTPGIGVESRRSVIVEVGLEHHMVCRLQEFEEMPSEIRPCSCSLVMMR